MHVTNRTDKPLTWATQTPGGPWITWEWIYPSKKYPDGQDRHQEQHEVLLYVSDGKISKWLSGELRDKNLVWQEKCLNTHGYLLVNGGKKVVDWSAVRDRYLNAAGSTSDAGGLAERERTQAVILEVASAVFESVVTVLHFVEKDGAVPLTAGVAGSFSLVAALLHLGDEPPPAPPTIKEIEQVVERVVTRVITEEFQRAAAEKAASKFLRAQHFLLTNDRDFRSVGQEKGRPRMIRGKTPDDVAKDFLGELKVWGAESGDFQDQIDLIRSQPEIAKWMIPEFIAGIAAYLHIRRLDVIFHKWISAATITDYLDEVEKCREALIATAKAWHGYCDTILRNESIQGTPEGNVVKDALTRRYAGVGDIGPLALYAGATSWVPEAVRSSSDKTPIGQATYALEQARKLLAEDIDAMNAGKPPTHFCTESLLEPVGTTTTAGVHS